MYSYKMIHLTPLGETVYKTNEMLINDLLEQPQTTYIKKQLDLLLYPMIDQHRVIYSAFKERSDYSCEDSIHHLHNIITHKDTYCFVEKYMILFKSDTKNNIFYDILYQNSDFYVILGK